MTAEPTMLPAASESPSSRERLLASGLALCLVAFAMAWYRGIARPPHTLAIFVALGSALCLCGLFATVLGIWRARLIRDVASARLAAALAYTVPVLTLYVVAFAVGAPGQQDAALWAAIGWNVGWSSFLIWYACSPPHRGDLLKALVVGIGASAVMVVVALSGVLPAPFRGTVPLNDAWQWSALLRLFLTLAALAMLMRYRRRTSLDLWLRVSLVPLIIAMVYAAFLRSSVSPEAQVVRVFTLISSIIVVCGLISEFARMVQRSSLVERFMTMAESAGTIVYLLDAGGAVTYMNRRWTDVTGQRVADALGEGWRMVLHPDDLRKNATTRAACMALRRPYRVEQRYRQANGDYRWYLSAATPVMDVDGKLAWYGTVTDIDAEHRALTEVEALYAREQRVSKMLQTAFLPSFLPELEGLALQGVYRPALHETEVGGDWYDVFTLHDGRLALSIGDVFGHGLEAATAMVRLRETFRASTAFTNKDPAVVLQTVDRVFASSHPETIASAVFAIYDPAERRLSMASAGHPPPALLRSGNVYFVGRSGVPLGVDSQSSFNVSTIILEEQDTVAFYTDGLTEANRDAVDGERQLASLLRVHAEDPERLVDHVVRGAQRDDIALLILSVVDTKAQPSWHFRSDDAASAEDARSAFTAHLRRRNVDREIIPVAELVFGELVGNVVRHAPGPIDVELTWRGERPRLIVRDRGPTFKVGEIALPSDDLIDHGRGLYIVSQFASTPVVTPRPGGGNEVVVELSATTPSRSEQDLITV
jgi:PAS domain S-box-containing protein